MTLAQGSGGDCSVYVFIVDGSAVALPIWKLRGGYLDVSVGSHMFKNMLIYWENKIDFTFLSVLIDVPVKEDTLRSEIPLRNKASSFAYWLL